MIGSGWEIYNASPLFPFVFPKSITLGGWLAGALLWHFAAMWLWVANGLVYVILGVLSENSIRPDSRGELESAHHPVQCLRSSACLGCSWPTSSSRERDRADAARDWFTRRVSLGEANRRAGCLNWARPVR